jgi:hypothetical protein
MNNMRFRLFNYVKFPSLSNVFAKDIEVKRFAPPQIQVCTWQPYMIGGKQLPKDEVYHLSNLDL